MHFSSSPVSSITKIFAHIGSTNHFRNNSTIFLVPEVNVLKSSSLDINLDTIYNAIEDILRTLTATATPNGAPTQITKVFDFYDTLPETIQFCLVVNAAFYLGWKLFGAQMAKHTTSSDENISSGRVWSLLLSAFSHKSLVHLALNMYGFLSIGPALLRAMGVRLFLISVVTAAVCSSLIPLMYNRVVVWLFPNSQRLMAKKYEVHLGFSGVNSALLLLYALIQPHAQFTSPFAAFVDGSTSGTVDAMSFLRSCIIGDLLGLVLDLTVTSTGISHAGHIGGFLGGYAVQQFVTETDMGRRVTPWSTRRKMDINLWSKLGLGS